MKYKNYDCPVCGKIFEPNKDQVFKIIHKGFKPCCSLSCAAKYTKPKKEYTSLKRHGVKSNFQLDSIRKTNSDKIKTPEYQEKLKKVIQNKYGVDNSFQIPHVREKLSEYAQDPIRQKQQLESKKKNNSCTKSKTEDLLYSKLLDYFNKDDVIRQYFSDLYPYACDFYIKSLDLYIEYNGYFTHGYRPFTNSKEDKELIEKWKTKYNEKQLNKNKSCRSIPGKQYLEAIKIFTISDVEKLNIAKLNNLNYLVFYNTNDFDNWINTLKKIDI